MKNLLNLIAIIALTITFFSCEQDNLMNDFSNLEDEQVQTNKEPVDLTETSEIELDSITLAEPSELEARSGRELIYETTATLNSNQWLLRYIDISSLEYDAKYVLKVTPVNGDPDAFIHGFNGQYRKIRESRRGSGYVEETYGKRSDLNLNAREYRLYFNVYASSHTTFKFEIFKENNNTCTNCLDGNYYIGSALGTVLDVKGSNPASATNVWAYKYNGTVAQKWRLIFAEKRNGVDYYYVKSDLGTYLDVKGANSASATNVWAYRFNGTIAQKWRIWRDSEGYYYFQSALGTYLDVANASSASATNVWAYKYNGTIAQKWNLYRR